jgi:uncharacterized protein
MTPRKSKAQKKEEVQELFEQVAFLLERIIGDNGVPRNIRKTAQESINTIGKLDDKENTPAVCASSCVTLLEDIAQDLNCPLHTRTQIYQVLSILEQVRDY